MSIDKAIEIAKKIDPAIGPSLEIDRKNLSDKELAVKLQDFFEVNKKAAEIVMAHPGKSPAELKQTIDTNISAHINNDFHILIFITNVLAKKSDLSSMAQSCARRIVLSDPRIEAAFKTLTVVEKAAEAEKIYNIIVADLVSYFENTKGKKLDSEAMVEELTTAVTKKVAETLHAEA